MKYRYNPSCGCARCRAHGFMGPAVLITVGVLFLLAQATNLFWLSFHHTWPALLIVIGLVLFLERNVPTTGHIPAGYTGYPVAPPPYPGQVQQQWHPPSPPSQAQPIVAAPAPSAGTTEQGEVHNG
jgi:LiaI-LiaF-like transmembrane region